MKKLTREQESMIRSIENSIQFCEGMSRSKNEADRKVSENNIKALKKQIEEIRGY